MYEIKAVQAHFLCTSQSTWTWAHSSADTPPLNVLHVRISNNHVYCFNSWCDKRINKIFPPWCGEFLFFINHNMDHHGWSHVIQLACPEVDQYVVGVNPENTLPPYSIGDVILQRHSCLWDPTPPRSCHCPTITHNFTQPFMTIYEMTWGLIRDELLGINLLIWHRFSSQWGWNVPNYRVHAPRVHALSDALHVHVTNDKKL